MQHAAQSKICSVLGELSVWDKTTMQIPTQQQRIQGMGLRKNRPDDMID
jgi:hypothetical protein